MFKATGDGIGRGGFWRGIGARAVGATVITAEGPSGKRARASCWAAPWGCASPAARR